MPQSWEMIISAKELLKVYLLHQKEGPICWFYKPLPDDAGVRWIFAGFIQHDILYETSEYLPGQQRHLGAANKTTYRTHQVSTAVSSFQLWIGLKRFIK